MSCCDNKESSIASTGKISLEDLQKSVSERHAQNLLAIALAQENIGKWLKNGIVGNAKYYMGYKDFSDEDIESNKATCLGCEHRSGKQEFLQTSDVCLAPDPEQNGAPCGCPIYKKIVTGRCPIAKWTSTPLTIKGV